MVTGGAPQQAVEQGQTTLAEMLGIQQVSDPPTIELDAEELDADV